VAVRRGEVTNGSGVAVAAGKWVSRKMEGETVSCPSCRRCEWANLRLVRASQSFSSAKKPSIAILYDQYDQYDP
jgi:hypothetical protein